MEDYSEAEKIKQIASEKFILIWNLAGVAFYKIPLTHFLPSRYLFKRSASYALCCHDVQYVTGMRLSFDKSLVALTVVDSFYGRGLKSQTAAACKPMTTTATEDKSSVWFLSLDKLFASLAYISTLENNAVQANLIRKLKSKLSNANGMGRVGGNDAGDMGGGGVGGGY